MQRKIYRCVERKNARSLNGQRRVWAVLDPNGYLVFEIEAGKDGCRVFDGTGTLLGFVPAGDQKAKHEL